MFSCDLCRNQRLVNRTFFLSELITESATIKDVINLGFPFLDVNSFSEAFGVCLTCFSTLKNFYELSEIVKNNNGFHEIAVVKCESIEVDIFNNIEIPATCPDDSNTENLEMVNCKQEPSKNTTNIQNNLYSPLIRSSRNPKLRRNQLLPKNKREMSKLRSNCKTAVYIGNFQCFRLLLEPIFNADEHRFISGRSDAVLNGWRAFYDALSRALPGISKHVKWWTKNSRAGPSKVTISAEHANLLCKARYLLSVDTTSFLTTSDMINFLVKKRIDRPCICSTSAEVESMEVNAVDPLLRNQKKSKYLLRTN